MLFRDAGDTYHRVLLCFNVDLCSDITGAAVTQRLMPTAFALASLLSFPFAVTIDAP